MITEDYVSFETAKFLKEKGFNEITLDSYRANGQLRGEYKSCNYPCPTQQMAMKWLREVYYLHITVHPGVSEYGFVWTYAIVFAKEAGEGETHFYKISQITTPIVKSKSYEKACEDAIKYCLENLI